MVARPFIKWAGGKTQLLDTILGIMPRGVRTYYEPFLGGGAVFFGMANEDRFECAVLNDWNAELVNTYMMVRDRPDDLIQSLEKAAAAYKADPEGGALLYDKTRKTDPKTLGTIERATRFIFLNKTCFNGLHRMNKKGEFNVPWGKSPNPAICDGSNIGACSTVLAKAASISTGDFSLVLTDVGPGDVVYLDPPYVPLTATANFASYTSDGFGIEEQKRLAEIVRSLADRGATVIESNSDTEVVRKLYDGFEIRSIQASRSINSDGEKRGPVGEVLIIHYGKGHEKPRPMYEMLEDE